MLYYVEILVCWITDAFLTYVGEKGKFQTKRRLKLKYFTQNTCGFYDIYTSKFGVSDGNFLDLMCPVVR